ncbi:MAG: glycosyltransferase family 2 protein [Patescibacteria group bacterium]
MSSITAALVYIIVFASLYVEVFLLATFFEKRKTIKREESEILSLSGYPSVTIIVPCFNEEKTLAKTIDSLLSLDYPKDKLNITIVDDGSTDGTWKEAKKFENKNGVRLFRKENGGKHTALNYALAHINTDLVGCLDADSFVEKDTLTKIVKYFEDNEVMAVTPAIKIYNPKRAIELMQNAEYNLGIFFKKMLGMIDAIQVTPGPFSVFRKKVFDNLGPYRKAHNTEDLELAFRMHESHYKIVNSHKAFVTTVAPNTIKSLYKQRLRWVHGFLENSIDYKHLFFNQKYGNFGMFMLPAAVLSVLSALYIVGYAAVNMINYVAQKILEIKIVGIENSFSMDLFFINTGTLAFLSIILATISVFMIIAGKHIAEDFRRFPLDIIYFFLIYVFIVPAWLFMATYNTVLSKRTPWR